MSEVKTQNSPSGLSIIIVIIVIKIIVIIIIIFTVGIKIAALITLVFCMSVCAVDKSLLKASSSYKSVVRVHILPSLLGAFVVVTQLPEHHSLEKNFGMRFEHILPLSGIAGEGVSIRFELFVGHGRTPCS